VPFAPLKLALASLKGTRSSQKLTPAKVRVTRAKEKGTRSSQKVTPAELRVTRAKEKGTKESAQGRRPARVGRIIAMEQAIALGCHIVEIDLRYTSDSHVVLVHDERHS